MNEGLGRRAGVGDQLRDALDELLGVARECGYPQAGGCAVSLACWAELVIEWREAAGLTSLRTPADVVRSLMVPALYALRLFEPGDAMTIVDLGAGSGATGAALAAVSGVGTWRLVDRARKKSTFCRYAIGRCRIPGLYAEELRELVMRGDTADVVLARGLPKTERTADAVRQVARPGGLVVTWCGGAAAPPGLVARCGLSDLWSGASKAECFT